MLGFGINANLAPGVFLHILHELDYLAQGGNFELVIVKLGATQGRNPLNSIELLHFSKRKIFCIPTTPKRTIQHLYSKTVGKFRALIDISTGVGSVQYRGTVGITQDGTIGIKLHNGKHRFVAGDQHTILGNHQIRLDEISTLGNGKFVCFQRVFRPGTAVATMADYDRSLA